MSDVYKVGISLIMTGNHGQFLSGMAKQLLGVHAHAHDLERTLGRLGRIRLAIGGGIAIAGGVTALKGVEKLVDKGNELVKVQKDMAAAGVSAAEAQEALGKAWEMTAKHKNIGTVEVMKLINDARMTFGSQHEATHHIDEFVKMASFLRSFEGGKHGHNATGFLGEVNAAMKSGEIAGKVSPEEMKTHVRQLTAMKVAYGEQLKIQQYLTAQRAAGVALRNTSDEFRYGMFPALVQENGSGAGVMLMTAFNKIVAGTGNRTKSLEHMAEIGLLNKSQLEYDKAGRIKGLKNPDAIKNSREAAMNFGDWVMNTLKPRIDKVAKGDHIKEAQFVSAMFPDRNAAKAITEILQQYTKFTKDAKLMAEAYKALDMEKYVDQSWEGQKQAFETQFENLVTALGAPIVGTATDMLARLNGVIAEFATSAGDGKNAEAIRNIAKGIAIAGLALTAGGAVALLAALGPAGWLTVGIVGLVATLGAFHADGVRSALGRLSMFFAFAKSEALIIQNHLKGLAADPKNMEMIRSTLTATSAEYELLKTGLGKALEWYKMVLGWRQTAQDAILGFLGKVGNNDHPGMSESAREGLRDREVDPMGVFVTKLIRFFKDLGDVLKDAVDGLVKEVTSWPGKLTSAITGMGSAIVAAIGTAIKNAISSMFGGGGASVTPGSFEGSGIGGATIHKASLGGGGKLDIPDFGGGAGGSGGSSFDAIMRAEGTAGKDPYNTVLGKGKYGLPDKALTDMTLKEAYAFGRTVRARHGSSSAIGAFQIVGRTMKDAAAALGLDMKTTRFTPEIQRRMAKWIAKTQGLGAWEGFKGHPNERAKARSGGWSEPADRPTVAPPPKQRELVAHHHTYLDGRKIATNVTKHQFRDGNGPATGANFADGSEAYPQIG